MKKPCTKYAKSGSINLAYQVFGSGDIDLVYIPGWISNIDLMWDCPELVNFLNELGKIARVILFDKRGTGLSDRVLEFPTLEERMDDIRAVMDAVGSEKAVLFGHSEGGSVSALFAATYPNRTISLIAFGVFAKRIYSKDYPWAPTNEQRQKVYDTIENNWGSGEMNLESLAPSKANDSVFMNWLANYFRSGASPSSALMLTKMNTQVDIVDILSSIKVPTLIMQRRDDIDVKVDEGRFITKRIKGSKLVELEGSDHLFWTGNTQVVLETMKSFILDVKPSLVQEKQLYTIIVGQLSSLGRNSPKYCKELIKEHVTQYNGTVIECSNGTFTATFKGPSKAVYCGMDLVETMKSVQAELLIGIHIKECFANHSICEEIGELASLLFNQAKPNQLLITQAVKNILVGVDLNLSSYKTIFDVISGESFLLFVINKKVEQSEDRKRKKQIGLQQSNSFLEHVFQTIDSNLSDEYFSVDALCRKVGVSERQLQRKLKASTQKSPNQLICSMRLSLAKQLILTKDDTISEIAFQAGFSNPSYFSKCFKKEFNRSPSDFKH